MRYAALLALLAAGCKTEAPPAPAPAPSSPPAPTALAATAPGPKPLRGVPKGEKELPTTAGVIAWANMEGQIQALAQDVASRPKDVYALRPLGAQKYRHGRVTGDLDEIDESIKLVTRCLEIDKKPDEYVERAAREQSLHRFKAAQADLDQGKKLGANADWLASVQADLDWNAGKYEPAIVFIRAQRQKSASAGTWTREGTLELELGNYEAADRAFEAAEDMMDDTSPFPVAQLDMTRGIQKQRQGLLLAAVAFFREAVRRLPQHVGAREHLAETLVWLGQDDEATKIYEEITKTSTDPEFMGALSSLYRAHGKTAEADALHAKAAARYDELIKKYPEAMYWHAAEFFGGDGKDPKKALDLLKKNLDLRPNATSQTALAKAYLANGFPKEAKEQIDKALAAPADEAKKHWVCAAVYKKLGDAAKSDACASRAKSMNPMIEKIEGAL
jgi:tetratricopeptide (TPR) repeat protein